MDTDHKETKEFYLELDYFLKIYWKEIKCNNASLLSIFSTSSAYKEKHLEEEHD